MEGGYAALHTNCCREPFSCPPYTGVQKRWCLINMKGINSALQTCVKACDFLFENCIHRVGSGV